MSRDRRFDRHVVFCSGPASMAPLVGSVAKELKYSNVNEWFTCRRGPRSVDLWLVRSVLKAFVNVDAWASPAHDGRIYVPAVWPVGFKSVGERERAW